MTDKTFTRAGISNLKGKIQFRFTNDPKRERVLAKGGHTDIQFFELAEPMNKAQATEFLIAQGLEENVQRATPASKAAPSTDPAVDNAAARARDEAVLAKLDSGELVYDEQSDSFKAQVAAKRAMFPSHTDAQLAELVQFQTRANIKEFGDTEPNF